MKITSIVPQKLLYCPTHLCIVNHVHPLEHNVPGVFPQEGENVCDSSLKWQSPHTDAVPLRAAGYDLLGQKHAWQRGRGDLGQERRHVRLWGLCGWCARVHAPV